MGLFTRSSRHPARAREERATHPFLLGASTEAAGTYAAVNVTTDTALGLSAVWACVRLLADVVSTLPIDVFRKAGAAEPLPTPALLVSPAAGWPVADWLYQLMASLLLRGNAYGLITARSGPSLLPAQVELVHPDAVTVTRTPEGVIEYRYGGQLVDRPDVFHVRAHPLPGCLTGLSPIAYARQTIGLGLATERFGAQYFGQSATPSALLISKNAMSTEQAGQLKERWRAAHEGRRDLAVLTGELDFKALTISPNESQFVESQRFNVSQVARIFGVPPEMIGGEAGGSLTYANVEQRSLDFLTYSVAPWTTRVENALSALLPRGQVVKLNTGALLRTDLKSRYEAHAIGLASGFLTVAEVRELENLPPLPAGNHGSH